jgi:hypothetical protein
VEEEEEKEEEEVGEEKEEGGKSYPFTPSMGIVDLSSSFLLRATQLFFVSFTVGDTLASLWAISIRTILRIDRVLPHLCLCVCLCVCLFLGLSVCVYECLSVCLCVCVT